MNLKPIQLQEISTNTIITILSEKGTTEPADNIPAIFRVGVGFDSESTTKLHTEKQKHGERTIVDYCFNYAYQIAIGRDNVQIVRTKDAILNIVENLVESVKDYNVSHETNAVLIIWCANLSHEWSFLKRDIYERFNITKMFAKSPRDVLYIQLDKCVEFRECIGLFGHSLDDIAKHWCSDDNQKLKGQFDYSKIRTSATPLDPETETPYMAHDVTTLAEMHENVINYYTQENGVCCLPYTSSGFVRMKLKAAIRDDVNLTAEREDKNIDRQKPLKTNIEYLKHKNYNLVTDAYQWHICRDYSYSGGLCGSNIDLVGKILHNVVCADLTSDYPAQFTHQKYPCGRLKKMHGNLKDVRHELEKQNKPYFAILKIKYMHAKTQHAVFSKHKIINLETEIFEKHGKPKDLVIYNGKVYSGKNLIVCWNDVDIKAYKECYDMKFGVLTLWAFDGYKRAPEWLLKSMWGDYEKKSLLKIAKKSDTQEYADSKRDVNTYYGVTATRISDSFDAFDECLNFIPTKEKTFKQMRFDFWLNPYLAFWCTSYARSILMHFISRYPDAIVQYDTDSLYYVQDLGADLEKELQEYNAKIQHKNELIFRNHEHKDLFLSLGQWDFDEVYTNFLGLGSKKYIKQTGDTIKTVIAGLPKNAIPKEIEEKAIEYPFNYYNPLVKWFAKNEKDIVIKHCFTNKFASVYNDDAGTKQIEITDHLGNTSIQDVGTYHALVPIDFTLSLAIEFIKEITKRRK